MGKFSVYVGSQFANPHGMAGVICCKIMNVINRAMYRRVVSLLQLPSGASLLDIGYGNGYLLKQIGKAYRAELYGIDPSEDMKLLASRRNKAADRAGRLHLTTGDCCRLPYGEDFFHAVTSVNTVYFWLDTLTGLREIRRCLRPGMCFYNVVYTKEWLDALSYTEKGFLKFEPELLVALGYEAGFTAVTVQEIRKGKSFVVICQK